MELSSALFDTAFSVRRLMHQAVADASLAPDGLTDLIQHVQEQGPAATTPPVVKSAFLGPALAGADHLEAMAAILRREESNPSAIATLARAAVEAFSRLYWVLQSESSADILRRQVSLQVAANKFNIKLDPEGVVSYANPDISDIRTADFIDGLSEVLKFLGVPEEKAPGTTHLATALLDAATGEGRLRYSRLSGLAHGEEGSINAFIKQAGDAPPRLSASFGLIMTCVDEAFSSAATTMDALHSVFPVPAPVIDRWISSRERTRDRIRGAQDIYRADPALGASLL